MEFKDRLKEKRLECGLTLEELALKIGTSKQTIHRYETGVISNIPSDKIEALAKALNTTPAYLMGWDDQTQKGKLDFHRFGKEESPLFEAAAGEGRLNDGYPSESYKIQLEPDEFVVRVVGRSMEPTLQDGDVVVVIAQNIIDYPRQIALVKINGEESTIKRVEIRTDGITLTGDNTAVYPPHFFTADQVEELPVRIEGVVTKLIREIK